jgi:TolB protein
MRRFMLIAAVVIVSAAASANGASRTKSLAEIAYLGNGDINVVRANGTDRRTLVAGREDFRLDSGGDISWSRDGKRIAFTVGSPDYDASTYRIYTAAFDGTDVRPLTTTAYGAFDPTWSPDGKRIAFTMEKGVTRAIAVIDADGAHLRKLTSSPMIELILGQPDWSPKGDWIAFDSQPRDASGAFFLSGVTTLLEIHPDGTGRHQIAAVDTSDACACADWSPDGTKIAFQAGLNPRDNKPEIYVMNANGSGRRQITRNPVVDGNPDWSPDGKWIAFYSNRRRTQEIYVIRANGGQARRVTNDPWPWASGFPAWRPRP